MAMHLKSVFVFFSVLALYSFGFKAQAYAVVQDSVKKVYVKVTAAEKPLQFNEDAFTDNNTPSAPKKQAKRYSKNKTNSISKIEPTKAAAVSPSPPKLEASTTTMLIKKADKPVPAVTAPHEQALSVDKDVHEEEISPAPITDDDSTVSDGTYLKTSKTYMWIGIVLVVVGIIMGILFGKTALLISIAGMVFVIIGYAIK